MATGLMFKFGWGQSLIPDRLLARNIHVASGLAILVSFAVAVVGRWGRALRADLGRINRWSRDDARWLRTFGGDRDAELGKFNPGQKLNAAFIGAAALVLAATGSMMKWNTPFSTDLRTGADFVHQWFAFGVYLAVAGHVVLALRDRESLRGMVGGSVARTWADRHSPVWLREPGVAEQIDVAESTGVAPGAGT